MQFSVVIPVYNVEKYIKECIESVLSQTYEDYELVLVNDGSTDSSAEFCNRYRATLGDRVQLINQENAGLLAARRVGFTAARGDYLISLDSDDMLRFDALEKIAKAHDEYGTDLVLYASSKKSDYSDFAGNEPFEKDTYIPRERKIELIRMICGTYKLNSMCSKSIKREMMDLEHSYEEYYGLSYAEDLLQSLPIIDRIESAYYIHEPLYYYRVNYSSLTKKFNPSQADARRVVWLVQKDYAERWAREYGDETLIDGVMSLSLQSFAEMSQAASEGLDTDEAIAFMKTLASSKEFVEANGWPHKTHGLRKDFRLIADLLVRHRYRSIIAFSRAKAAARKHLLKR